MSKISGKGRDHAYDQIDSVTQGLNCSQTIEVKLQTDVKSIENILDRPINWPIRCPENVEVSGRSDFIEDKWVFVSPQIVHRENKLAPGMPQSQVCEDPPNKIVAPRDSCTALHPHLMPPHGIRIVARNGKD